MVSINRSERPDTDMSADIPPSSSVEGTKKIKSPAALRKAGIAVVDIGERIEHAGSIDALEALQEEFEAVLRGAVMGARDGTISSDGLDAFRLGCEFVRDEIANAPREPATAFGHGDNVVVVKAAQGARACESAHRFPQPRPAQKSIAWLAQQLK